MTQLTIQGLFNETKEAWLQEARKTAVSLLKSKESITIEDVLRDCPRPDYLHRNVTGHVFKHHDFKLISYEPARRAVANGRIIGRWTLKGRTLCREQ